MTQLASIVLLALLCLFTGLAILNHELRILAMTKEVDDLKAAQANIAAAVSTAAADLAALAAQVSAGQAINPADIEAIAVNLQASADALNAASTAAVPPAAAPAT